MTNLRFTLNVSIYVTYARGNMCKFPEQKNLQAAATFVEFGCLSGLDDDALLLIQNDRSGRGVEGSIWVGCAAGPPCRHPTLKFGANSL